MKKHKFNFRDMVNEDVQARKTAKSTYGYLSLPKGVKMFKEEPSSRVKLDIIPYMVTANNHPDKNEKIGRAVPNSIWYKRPFKIHRSVGVKNDTIVCPTSVGKRCPICDYRAKRLKEGAEKSETDAMKASGRNLYVVIPLDSKKYDVKMHVWDISQAMFQDYLDTELQENPEYGDFPSLEDGRSLSIRFVAKTLGKGKPFAETNKLDFKDREEQYSEEILEEVPNLDELLIILPPDEIETKFFELEDEPTADADDEDEDEDEPEEKPIARHKKQLKPEPEEDEDEPEEKPIRRKKPEPEKSAPVRKTKPSRKPEPEDDEDEDEDEDEPEEKPIRKNKPEPPKHDHGKTGKNVCPFGHRFGKDVEKFDDCDNCEKWDACVDESEK